MNRSCVIHMFINQCLSCQVLQALMRDHMPRSRSPRRLSSWLVPASSPEAETTASWFRPASDSDGGGVRRTGRCRSQRHAASWLKPTSDAEATKARAPRRQLLGHQTSASWLRPPSDSDAPAAKAKLPNSFGKRRTRRINVSAAVLAAAAGPDSSKAPTSAYSLHGKSRDRIRERLSSGTCNCTRQCHKQFNVKQVGAMCDLYWGMREEERAFLLHTLYNWGGANADDVEAPCTDIQDVTDDEDAALEPLRTRTEWSFAGTVVCFSAFCALLGVGERTMLKQCRGALDMRRSSASMGPCQPKRRLDGRSLECDWFFLETYMTSTEPLPHEEYLAGSSIDADLQVDGNPWLAADDVEANLTPTVLPSLDVSLDDWSSERSFSEHAMLLIGDGEESLRNVPRRFLPHGRVHDLYWQMVASWETKVGLLQGRHGEDMLDKPLPQETSKKEKAVKVLKPPSFTTFLRRWHAKWKFVLRFRKISQHADCNICFKLREKVHGGRMPLGERLAAAREWRAHLRWQYYDRCLYWSHRYASRSRTMVLLITVDTMDKAKTSHPRWKTSKLSKDADKFVRPRSILTGVLAHGYCGCVFLADESLPHGASACAEVIAQTIQRVFQKCAADGLPMPAHLIIQSDNTVAQAKNSDFNIFCAFLAAKYFRTVDVHYLTEGHTHLDIDQFFAVILELILRRHTWETPEQLIDLIASVMSEKFKAKGEDLHCSVLTGVRDFATWLQPLGVELKGAFASRKIRRGVGDTIWSPHSFTYKKWEDMQQCEKSMLSSVAQPQDVFCLVKAYMHDQNLLQAPLLVLPAARVPLLADPAPTTLCPREALQPARKEQLLAFADLLEKPEFHYLEAAKYMRYLANQEPGRATSLLRLQWLHSLRREAHVSAIEVSGNPYYAHLPDIPWRLLASFQAMAGPVPAPAV